MPADFKRDIDGSYGAATGAKFFITSKDGLVAEIYPLQEWEKIEAKLAAISNFNPAKKKFLERVNYYGKQVEMDNQGRLLLPQILRDEAKLMDDVDVFGRINYLEVVNHEAFRRNLDANPWTDADGENLELHGV